MTPLDEAGKQGQEAAARFAVANDGKEYLEEKRVFPLVQGLVLDLLLEKPVDPVAHMLKRLQEQASVAGGMQAAMSLLEEAKIWREQYTDASARLEEAETQKQGAEAKVAELQDALEQEITRNEDLTRLLEYAASEAPELGGQIRSSIISQPVSPTSASRDTQPGGALADLLAPLKNRPVGVPGRADRGMSVVIQTMAEHKKEVEALGADLLIDDWVQNVISSAEFESVALERFEICDVTSRGALTVDELEPLLQEIAKGLPFEMRKKHVEEFLNVFDMDHNGMISKEEFLNFAKVIFVHVAMGRSGKKKPSAGAASSTASANAAAATAAEGGVVS
jgi:hypothetical protein